MNTSLLKLSIVSAIMFTLSACGGGGGSDSSNNTGGGTPPPPVSYTVTASAGSGGSISPASRSVVSGQTTTFSVSANEGYNINQVTGCNGSLSGSTYTTGAITSACTVSASFSLKTYTVTATAGDGGSITPESATVNHGSTTEFTITPNSGFGIESVTGCEGSLEGNTYTTGSITGACSVEAEFTELSGVAAALQFTIAGGVSLQTLESGVVSVQGQAVETMSTTATANQSTLFNYQRVMGSPDAADFSATSDRLLSESDIPSNLLVLDEDGNLRLAIDSTLPIKVMYTVLDPSGENVYVALSRDWQDGIDYSTSIAALDCALLKVSVADNELSCVAEGVLVQEMNDSFLQTISNNNKPLLFSEEGTLYFAGRDFTREDGCVENPDAQCWISSESVLFVYSVATDGTVTKLTNDLMNVESFQVLADGQLVIYGWNEASGQQELNLVNDGQTLRVSQTWGVEFFTVDDDRTVVFGDYNDRNIRLARPREAGGMERTSLSTSLFSELSGGSHPVRVITGDDGRVYGVFNAWRSDTNPDTGEWVNRNFLSVYQMLPFNGTPIADIELQDGDWWTWMQRTPFQINKGHLYYVETIDVPFFGRSDVLKMVNIETRTTTTLLDDFDNRRYQFHNWRLSGDILYFSAQDLTRSITVSGELNTIGVRDGASEGEFLALRDVASAQGAAVAIQDIEVLRPEQPVVDTGSSPRVSFYGAPENRFSVSMDFTKYMNRKTVIDNLVFQNTASEEDIAYLPIWFFQTLHLVPDTSPGGLGDSIARGLERGTSYTIALGDATRDVWNWDLTGEKEFSFSTLGDEYFQLARNSVLSDYPSNADALVRLVAPSGNRAKLPATIDFTDALNNFEFSFTMRRHGDQAEIAIADNETEWLKIINEGWRLRLQFMQESGPAEFNSYIPNSYDNARWLDFKIVKQGDTLQVFYGRNQEELELIEWWWENDTDTTNTLANVVIAPENPDEVGIYVTTGFNNIIELANVAFVDTQDASAPRSVFNSNEWLAETGEQYFEVSLLPRQSLQFVHLTIEKRVNQESPTRNSVQAAFGQTYRFFHGAEEGQEVRAQWPDVCEGTITDTYVGLFIPLDQGWNCNWLNVQVFEPVSLSSTLSVNLSNAVALQTLEAGIIDVGGASAAMAGVDSDYSDRSSLFTYERAIAQESALQNQEGILANGNSPSNLLALDVDGNLRLAIDSTIPIKVMYTVLDPSGENVYIALSRDWQDGIDYGHSIAQLDCALLKVSVADNELSCVTEGVLVQEMNDSYLQTISNNKKPLLFSEEGTLYFAGREFVRDDRCLENPNDHCYISSESVLFVYSVGADGAVTKLTNDLMNIQSFQVLADGQLVIYGSNEASGQQELNLVNDGQTLRVSQTWGVEFFTVDDDRTVVFGDYSDGNIRFARPREGGGMERTSLSTSLFSELSGDSHPVRIITGDDGRVYGVFSVWRNRYNPDTDSWEGSSFLTVNQILPYNGTPIAEIKLEDGNWWTWMQRTPFQINKGYLYYTESVDVLNFGRSDVLKMVNVETREETTLLNDFDNIRYQFYNWRLSDDMLYFSAQDLSRSVSVYGELDTLAVRDGASVEEFLTLRDVASARGTAVAIQDIEILTPQQPLVNTGGNPRVSFYTAPENRFSVSMEFTKYMNRERVNDNLTFRNVDSGEDVAYMPVWFYQSLHLIPDTSPGGLGDAIARGLDKESSYIISFEDGVRDAWNVDLIGDRELEFTTLGDEFIHVIRNTDSEYALGLDATILRYVAPGGSRARLPAEIDFSNALTDFEFSFSIPRHPWNTEILLADSQTDWLKIINDGWRLRLQYMNGSELIEVYADIPSSLDDSHGVWLDFKVVKVANTLQVLFAKSGDDLELISWQNGNNSQNTLTNVTINPSNIEEFGIYFVNSYGDMRIANIMFTDISDTAAPRVVFNSNTWATQNTNVFYAVAVRPRFEAVAKPEAYGQDESIVVEFQDAFLNNTNVNHTVVVSKNASLTIENFDDEENIRVANARSPQEVIGLENNTTYYVAIVTDFYNEATFISEVTSVVTQAAAAGLKFHVTDAEHFILYERVVAAHDVDGNRVATAADGAMGYRIDRSAKATNFMKRTASGEVAPVIESRDYTVVESFVITPDQKSLIVALADNANPDWSLDARTVIARNNCAIFKVDLATSEHACLAEGWLPRDSHNETGMALWGRDSAGGSLTLSGEIEDGEWVGTLYLRAYSFEPSSCGSNVSDCWLNRSYDEQLIKIANGEVSVVLEEIRHTHKVQAIDKNHVAVYRYDDMANEWRLLILEGSSIKENMVTHGFEPKVVVDEPGQYLISGVSRDDAARFGEINAETTKRTSLSFWTGIRNLISNEHGDLYVNSHGAIDNLLPKAEDQLQIDVADFWAWYDRSRIHKPLIIRGGHLFFVEASEHVSFGSQDIIRMQGMADNNKQTAFELPDGDVLTVLHWHELNGQLTFAARNETQQTAFIGELDLDKVLAGDDLAESLVTYPITLQRNQGSRVKSMLQLPSNPDAVVPPELLVRFGNARLTSDITIALRFNQAMDRSSVLNSVNLLVRNSEESVPFVPFWLGNTLHLIPDVGDIEAYTAAPLERGVDYELRFTGEIRNAAGTELDWANAKDADGNNVGPQNALLVPLN